MPPAPGSKPRRPHIATVEEYDHVHSRKRLAKVATPPMSDVVGCALQCNGHSHGHKHHTSAPHSVQAAASRISQFTRAIMSDSESRSIFMFLLLNLSYMFVQIVYGYLSNSLGLISDAIHMLFDCMALAIGLIAAVMSKWPPSESFTFGYDRIEILSGFSNGVFLMLISVSIFFEAIERLIHPPEMNTHRLLLVQNMQGVFLHVMADTLGSVGVIISTLLIQWFGWTGFDPLASIVIAVLIFASVVPLVRDSMHMLLLRLPDDAQAGVQLSLELIHEQIGGIAAIPKAQFWPVTETRIMGVVHVKVDQTFALGEDEHPLCAITMRDAASGAISEIFRANVPGLRDVFVQVEAD
ncbi:hypothetical protein GGI04_003855 [Coemansia thaxteri]|nr:hypothetical protein GGI04_003855 [Coemansia thaxteri]